MLLEPIATFPKLRLVGLAVRFPDNETQPDCVRTVPRIIGNIRKMKELRQIEILGTLARTWDEFEAK